MSGESEKVIDLSTGEPVTQIKTRDRDSYCMSRCENILINPHKREVTCRECGAVIDSFDWAEKMANVESRFMQKIHHLKTETIHHENRVEELKAEELRVKARVRAAKDSLLKSAGI